MAMCMCGVRCCDDDDDDDDDDVRLGRLEVLGFWRAWAACALLLFVPATPCLFVFWFFYLVVLFDY
jgi:hypothetical protein